MSEDELPEGWARTVLGYLTHVIQYGYTASAKKSGIGPRFLRITDIQNGHVDWQDVPTCEISGDDLTRFQLEPGDIVFARTGATTGKSFLIDSCPKAVFASYLIRLRALPAVVPRFLTLFFQTPSYWAFISDNSSGIAQPNCNASKLAALPVPVPPLAEQERIVAKVDELLARVNAAREHLARIPAILKHFRQAILAAACNGRLTEEWRGPRTEPWSGEVSLGGFLSVKSGFAFASKDFQSVGIPVVRQGDLARSGIDLLRCARVPESYLARYAEFALSKGDVLIGMSGAIGKLCAYGHDMPALQNQRVGRLVPKAGLAATYLALLFEHLQPDLQARGKGMGVSNVSAQDIETLHASFPPLSEQREIVRRVEALFNLADAIEKRVAATTARAEKLTQAILAKAFRGELVPTEAELARRKGQGYEPATELLERVKGQPVVTVEAGRRRASRPKVK